MQRYNFFINQKKKPAQEGKESAFDPIGKGSFSMTPEPMLFLYYKKCGFAHTMKMTIRISHKEASMRFNFNNTVKKVLWTFDSAAEYLAKRSAVTDNQHLTCVSE